MHREHRSRRRRRRCRRRHRCRRRRHRFLNNARTEKTIEVYNR